MSKVALFGACQFWARDGVPWADSTSDDASFGKALHALCENYIEERPLPAVTDPALAAVWDLVRVYIDARKRAGWMTEVAFALDLTTGNARELPRGEHRDYSAARPSEICGTADLVYMAEDDGGPFACVDDWKWSGFHGDDAKAQAQLAGLALCVARAYGADRVRARALRVSDSGVDDTTEVYWLDAFDLDAMTAELRIWSKAIATAEPTPGPHCVERWCPARASCPATTAALAQVIPTTHLVRDHRLGLEITGPEHAAWALSAVDLVEDGLKAIKAKLREYADTNGGIALGDGRVWAGHDVASEKADLAHPGAIQELQSLGVGNAIEASVTWSAITRVGGAAKAEQARAALRAIGATKVSSYKKYEPRGSRKGRAA